MSKKDIYKALRAGGMSRAGTIGMMANIGPESGFVSYRLQGDFSDGFLHSKEYTKSVDKGEISSDEFIYRGPGGGGYGLCQWTWPPRKKALYEFAYMANESIGDEYMQTQFILAEMQTAEYLGLFKFLCETNDIYEATKRICFEYERPAGTEDPDSEDALAIVAKRYYNYAMPCANEAYDDEDPTEDQGGCSDDTCPIEMDEEICEIGVRVLRRGKLGRDVFILQTALNDMGCDCGVPDGDFGPMTEAGVKDLQQSCDLEVTGVAGQIEWQIIFQ